MKEVCLLFIVAFVFAQDAPKTDVVKAECRTPDNREGICVVYYQCSDNGTVIKDGTGIFDVRMEGCEDKSKFCCAIKDVDPTATPPPTTLTTAPQNPTTVSTSTTTSPATSITTTTVAPTKLEPRGCGYSQIPSAEGGVDGYSKFLEFPWVIALLNKTAPEDGWTDSDYIGAGTLIHPSVVLTTANKVQFTPAKRLKCRAGEYKTTTIDEFYPHQEREVRKVKKHENFYNALHLNDIALIFLSSPFDMAPNVRVACLSRTTPLPGSPCQAAGWGKKNLADDVIVDTMKKVELLVVSRAKCQIRLRGTRLGEHYELPRSLTCAGGIGDDTCRGDGGGPLMYAVPARGATRYAVFGITAFGIGCNRGVPGVYVSVPDLLQWINTQVKAQGFDTDVYTV